MSASHGNLESVILLQLVAALQSYENDVAEITADPVAPEAYGRVRVRLDEIRNYANSLPKLAVPWVELLIAHFELTHGLWRVRESESDGAATLETVRERHDGALDRLRQQCLRLAQERAAPGSDHAAGRGA
jgi:hypothetical protein